MRITVYSCDRCGQAYKPFKSKSGMMGMQMFRKNGKNADRPYEYGMKKYLCPTCLEEMESWYFEERDEDEDLSEETSDPEPEIKFEDSSEDDDIPFNSCM